MTRLAEQTRDVISFGPFSLVASERLLTKDGTLVELGARTLDALPQVHILATSRKALRVEGEHVYKLDPLACPPDDPGLTAEVAQTFPAPQLFVERALASGARLDLGDADAAIVVGICRKLDGVALAIELAARRVVAYGLQQTAALLDQRLTLLWLGPRTAPPRQRTLRATLDWSYGLLSELERVVLRRLAVFVGHFTLDAALAVATSATVDQALVFAAIDSLVAKSMVATRPVGAMMRYRLLDTTRAYVLETGADDAELVDLAVRHVAYCRQWLEQSGTDWPKLSTGAERAPHFAALNNVRAALDWCFGANGNAEIGVGLTVAAAPVFLAMSLLPECHRWSERAILALDDGARGGLEEMRLQADLGRVIDVHARRTRCGACGLEQKLRNRRRTWRRPRSTAAVRSAEYVSPAHRRFQNSFALRAALLHDRRNRGGFGRRATLAHSIGFRSTSAAISAAPAWSLRRRCRSGPRAQPDHNDLPRLRGQNSRRRHPGKEFVVAMSSRSSGGARTPDHKRRRGDGSFADAMHRVDLG